MSNINQVTLPGWQSRPSRNKRMLVLTEEESIWKFSLPTLFSTLFMQRTCMNMFSKDERTGTNRCLFHGTEWCGQRFGSGLEASGFAGQRLHVSTKPWPVLGHTTKLRFSASLQIGGAIWRHMCSTIMRELMDAPHTLSVWASLLGVSCHPPTGGRGDPGKWWSCRHEYLGSLNHSAGGWGSPSSVKYIVNKNSTFTVLTPWDFHNLYFCHSHGPTFVLRNSCKVAWVPVPMMEAGSCWDYWRL